MSFKVAVDLSENNPFALHVRSFGTIFKSGYIKNNLDKHLITTHWHHILFTSYNGSTV